MNMHAMNRWFFKMADVVNRFQMLDEKCESVDELPIDMADTIAAAVQAQFE